MIAISHSVILLTSVINIPAGIVFVPVLADTLMIHVLCSSRLEQGYLLISSYHKLTCYFVTLLTLWERCRIFFRREIIYYILYSYHCVAQEPGVRIIIIWLSVLVCVDDFDSLDIRSWFPLIGLPVAAGIIKTVAILLSSKQCCGYAVLRSF